MTKTFNSLRIFALFFILLCFFGSGLAATSSPLLLENPEEAFSLSIQLPRKTIQASSIEKQIFTMLLSSKINKLDLSSFPQNPVDLVCVFEIKHDEYSQSPSFLTQIEEIRNLLKDLQPLMTDQDRLAVVLFYSQCGSGTDKIFPVIDDLPITKMPSLNNTTTQNWKTIIHDIADKIIFEDISVRTALKAATKILNQRTETNRTTGVFISSNLTLSESQKDCSYDADEGRIIEEIDSAKRNAEVQDNNWIIQIFPDEPKGFGKVLAESLVALRAGIVETQLFVKAEKSELLKNFQFYSSYFNPYRKGWEKENEVIMKRFPSVRAGEEEESAFELMIPRTAAQDLPSSPMEVKIASYQLGFLLNNGSQVVMKNTDLTLKIVREGEKITDEEESREVVRNFYQKWGKKWVIKTAWMFVVNDHDYEEAKQLLKKYKESLDDSIVKDDEMLQKIWKDTLAEIIWDQEMSVRRN